MTEIQGQNKDFVQSLARGLSIIVCMTNEQRGMTLTEVAKKVDLTRAAARRFLLTLQQLGYVDQLGKEFHLTPKVLEIGYTYISSMPLAELSGPYLDSLLKQLNESCSISVLHDREVVCLARRKATNRVLSLNINVGARLPVHATSMGRVLMSGLDTKAQKTLADTLDYTAFTSETITDADRLLQRVAIVRERGWDIAENEREPGLISASVPITDLAGNVTACMNVSSHISAMDARSMEDGVIPIMCTARDQLNVAFNSRT